MKKLKGTISFSSFIEDKRYFTSIDLILNLLIVIENEDIIFEGTIEKFKELEKLKSANTDKVYEDLLRMSEELIEILTKA